MTHPTPEELRELKARAMFMDAAGFTEGMIAEGNSASISADPAPHEDAEQAFIEALDPADRAQLDERNARMEKLPIWKCGRLVVLRSGGPVMTIADDWFEHQRAVQVEWFVGGVVHRDSFLHDTLVLV